MLVCCFYNEVAAAVHITTRNLLPVGYKLKNFNELKCLGQESIIDLDKSMACQTKVFMLLYSHL